MAGLCCADCVFSSFSLNKEVGKYQGACARGYTLAVPHVYREPDRFFTDDPRKLVPVTDPYGNEYLRKSNVCDGFSKRDKPDLDAGDEDPDADVHIGA